MRRARSQLNKVLNNNPYGYGQHEQMQSPFTANNEAAEIQRRLDQMQQQNMMMQQNQPFANDPYYSGGIQQPSSPMMHQPLQQQAMMPQVAPQQPVMSSFPQQAPAFAPQTQQMTSAPMQQTQVDIPYAGAINQQPVQRPVNDAQLDNIKLALQEMGSRLHTINQNNEANRSGAQQTDILAQHYHSIASELQQLKNSFAGFATSKSSDVGFETIRETLNANYNAIMQRLENSEGATIDSSVFSSALEASHKELSNQILDIKSAMEASVSNPNAYAKTLEISHEDITKRLDDMHNALQTAIAQPGHQTEIIESNNRLLTDQIVSLQNTVDQIKEGKSEAPEVDFSNVESRLEEITRAVVALSLNDDNLDNLERIEARVSDLAKTVDTLSSEGQKSAAFDNSGFDKIETKLSDIASLMNVSSPDIGDITLQIHALSDKIDTLSNSSQPSYDNSGLDKIETKLSDIASLMNESSPDIGDITLQIHALSDKIDTLSNSSQPSYDNSGFDKIETKLSDIASLMNESSPDIGDITLQIHALSDKIDTLSNSSQPSYDNSGFDKIETKLSDIAGLMSANSPDIGDIMSQIHTLSEKFDNLSAISNSAPIADEENNALLQRMDKLVEQIDKSQSVPLAAEPNDAMLSQLEQMAGAIDQLALTSGKTTNDAQLNAIEKQIIELSKQMNSASVVPAAEISFDPITKRLAGIEEQISSSRDITIELASKAAEDAVNRSVQSMPQIEKQIIELSKQMNSASVAPVATISLDPITDRLSGIEEQIGSSRDVTIELATKAAEEAVKKTVQAMPQNIASGVTSDINPALLQSMSQMLENLNQNAESTNSTNIEAFGAVSQTLSQMAERLGNIETGLASYPKDNAQIPASAQAVQGFAALDEIPLKANNEIQPEFDGEQKHTEQVVSKTSNPADNLVKAAREKAKAAQSNVADMASSVMDNAVVEPEVNNDFSETAAKAAMLASPSALPETDAPAMVMETMPEMGSENHSDIVEEVALEPGSGAPDLAALVRQANENRKNKGTDVDSSGTDFIAAARRAAQAAAQEAGAVEEEIVEKKKKNLLSSIPELFAKRKKAILMGAAALLFAAIVVPFAGKFLDPQRVNIANQNNETPIEQTVDTINTETPSVAALNAKPSNLAGSVEELESEVSQVLAEPELEAQNVSAITQTVADEIKPEILINVDGIDFVSTELKDAAQSGNPAALFEIGKRYTDAIGTQKDLTKASEWYERSANFGYAPAQYIIGNFNEKGLGIEKNLVKASEWYEKAAKGGNVIAMHNLAVLNATPNALSEEPNMPAAFEWFSKAADYGVRDSQVNAGIFYTRGFGTQVNLVEAYKWFSIAAKAGDKDAASKREVIANAIAPDDLEIAKSLIDEWKPLDVVKAANEVTVEESWKSAQQAQSVASNFTVDRNVIAQTQQLLSKIGFNAGVADGVMGRKTQNAIAAFQQKSGLPVTGKIDAELIKTLRAIAI